MSRNLHNPLFVSYYFETNSGQQGWGSIVLDDDFILNSNVSSMEDILTIGETIKEKLRFPQNYRVAVMNFRRVEP